MHTLKIDHLYKDFHGNILRFVSPVVVDIGELVEIFWFVRLDTNQNTYYTESDIINFEEVQ